MCFAAFTDLSTIHLCSGKFVCIFMQIKCGKPGAEKEVGGNINYPSLSSKLWSVKP